MSHHAVQDGGKRSHIGRRERKFRLPDWIAICRIVRNFAFVIRFDMSRSATSKSPASRRRFPGRFCGSRSSRGSRQRFHPPPAHCQLEERGEGENRSPRS
ncbi:Uncharacterized protein PBTT_10232 [Plasmodiophora brassicae]